MLFARAAWKRFQCWLPTINACLPLLSSKSTPSVVHRSLTCRRPFQLGTCTCAIARAHFVQIFHEGATARVASCKLCAREPNDGGCQNGISFPPAFARSLLARTWTPRDAHTRSASVMICWISLNYIIIFVIVEPSWQILCVVCATCVIWIENIKILFFIYFYQLQGDKNKPSIRKANENNNGRGADLFSVYECYLCGTFNECRVNNQLELVFRPAFHCFSLQTTK